nr:GrpB family protein [Ensifer aridi]
MFPVGKVEIVDWSPEWPESFRRKASAIRRALGDRALRTDHIGSTSIQGLAAKPPMAFPVPLRQPEIRASYRL